MRKMVMKIIPNFNYIRIKKYNNQNYNDSLLWNNILNECTNNLLIRVYNCHYMATSLNIVFVKSKITLSFDAINIVDLTYTLSL